MDSFALSVDRAEQLDAADPLARFVDEFEPSPDVVAYLDGNSLGRPTRATTRSLARFVSEQWASRLIRGWDEGWFTQPEVLGDRIGTLVLGAGPGQTIVADSTSVILYKLVRAALRARPGRDEIVVDEGNFPTDRYIVEGVAAEFGLALRWLRPDEDAGVTVDDVRAVVSERTAVVLLSHVAYRSGFLADVPGVVEVAHESGSLVLLDLCHSVGVIPMQLDEYGVDLAAGCTYKYLNGGPGSPAFGYVRSALLEGFSQPIQGWIGAARPFEMGPGYDAHPGIRRLLSGTPNVVGMLGVQDMLDLVEAAGIDAIRAKSIALTEYVLELVDSWLVPRGVVLASPRDPARRGSHVTVDWDGFERILPLLWERGVIPDFRRPDGLRLGLSPLSTSFAEVHRGVAAIASTVAEHNG